MKSLPGVSNITFNLDLLGIYFPRNERSMVGFVANAIGDRYEKDGEWTQINWRTYSISSVLFFRDRIGKGPFMRADIGLTQLRVDSSVTSEDTSDWGRGVLGGVGFGHPITDGTRLLFQVNYGWRRVKGDSVGTLNLTLGGLW